MYDCVEFILSVAMTTSTTGIGSNRPESPWNECASVIVSRVKFPWRNYLKENIALYADLPSMRASENPAAIPEDTLVTLARAEIALAGVDEVTLIELTIPNI